jgi:hypothetical protein
MVGSAGSTSTSTGGGGVKILFARGDEWHMSHLNNKRNGSRTGTGAVDFDQRNAGVEKNENATANANTRPGVTFVAHDGHDNDDAIPEYDLDNRHSVENSTGPTITGDDIDDNADKDPIAHPPLGKKKLV